MFDRDWLHAAINRAADKAGYPSWWLTNMSLRALRFICTFETTRTLSRSKQLQETVQ